MTPAGAKILYVDDEPVNLRVFEANFRAHLPVLTEQSPKAALALLESRPQEIGVLLVDQRMPEMTGVELLERARTLIPDAARMLITAYSDLQAVMDAVNRGQVSRYFVKPWNRDELLAALSDALRIYDLNIRLREVEVRMVSSERLAALGQVAGGLVHELMNPVGYVSQNISALRTELDAILEYVKPKLAEQPVKRIQQTVDDVPQLLADLEVGIAHLRDIATRVRGQISGQDKEEHANVDDVITFVVKLARPEVQTRARIAVTGPRVQVRMGPVHLSQIILNLVINAAQAIDGSGRQGIIDIRWVEKNDQVWIAVEDNGVGMSPEVQAKMFDPLFTTKKNGTGLGLAICRDLVRTAGGEIQVRSQVGRGTTVELRLPRLAAS